MTGLSPLSLLSYFHADVLDQAVVAGYLFQPFQRYGHCQ